MLSMHPELRKGLTEEHFHRLLEDRWMPPRVGRARQLAAQFLLTASNWLAGERPSQASSASLTSLSASSLCSRRTAV